MARKMKFRQKALSWMLDTLYVWSLEDFISEEKPMDDKLWYELLKHESLLKAELGDDVFGSRRQQKNIVKLLTVLSRCYQNDALGKFSKSSLLEEAVAVFQQIVNGLSVVDEASLMAMAKELELDFKIQAVYAACDLGHFAIARDVFVGFGLDKLAERPDAPPKLKDLATVLLLEKNDHPLILRNSYESFMAKLKQFLQQIYNSLGDPFLMQVYKRYLAGERQIIIAETSLSETDDSNLLNACSSAEGCSPVGDMQLDMRPDDTEDDNTSCIMICSSPENSPRSIILLDVRQEIDTKDDANCMSVCSSREGSPSLLDVPHEEYAKDDDKGSRKLSSSSGLLPVGNLIPDDCNVNAALEYEFSTDSCSNLEEKQPGKMTEESVKITSIYYDLPENVPRLQHHRSTQQPVCCAESSLRRSEQNGCKSESEDGDVPSTLTGTASPLQWKEELSASNTRARSGNRRKRTVWTAAEEDALFAGVQKYGCRKWKQIKDNFDLPGRSASDLRDKWRNMKKYWRQMSAVRERMKLNQKHSGDSS